MLVTFSLNPEAVADLWEGKFDDGVRVTPTMERRLEAALHAQELGFEVRWRVDPIIPVEGWEELYAAFFATAAREGHRPTRITFGTYRETQPSLLTFAKGWGLPAMEWTPDQLEKDGMHYHLSPERRVAIYRALSGAVRKAWDGCGTVPIAA